MRLSKNDLLKKEIGTAEGASPQLVLNLGLGFVAVTVPTFIHFFNPFIMQQSKSPQSPVPYTATDFNPNNQPVAISGTQQLSNLIRLLFPQDDYFEVNYYALYLNERNEALHWKYLGSGPGGNHPTDVKQIVADLYFAEANQLLLVHSQPTGKLKADAKTQHFTEQIRLLLALCEASLADHIIINENSYYSMLEAGDILPVDKPNN